MVRGVTQTCRRDGWRRVRPLNVAERLRFWRNYDLQLRRLTRTGARDVPDPTFARLVARFPTADGGWRLARPKTAAAMLELMAAFLLVEAEQIAPYAAEIAEAMGGEPCGVARRVAKRRRSEIEFRYDD